MGPHVTVGLINVPDDPYSLEQLKSPRMNVAVVRPLIDHLYDPDDVSIGMASFDLEL